MKEKIFANIFFCEGVHENIDTLDINGVFSLTQSFKTDPYTIFINSTVYGGIEGLQEKSLYYILEANIEKGKRYKLLKEIPLQKLDISNENINQDNTAFVFNNRKLISGIGEYFVKVYFDTSGKDTQNLIKSTEKISINSQVLIVE